MHTYLATWIARDPWSGEYDSAVTTIRARNADMARREARRRAGRGVRFELFRDPRS